MSIGEATEPDPRMVALHWHWLYADSINMRVGASVLSEKSKEKLADLGEEKQLLLALGEMHSQFLALQISYALLYVVIEGYRELKLTDARIDAALAKEDYVDYLRRFRNSVFHYQAEPLNDKLLGFLARKDSEVWIRELNKAFDEFFCAYPPLDQFLAMFGQAKKR